MLMKISTFVIIILTLLKFTPAYAQDDNLKIRIASNGKIVSFGYFEGQLIFNNGDTLGGDFSKFNWDSGYFLACYDSTGQTLWTRFLKNQGLNCSGFCPGIGLCIDKNDQILVTGGFTDTIYFNSGYYLNTASLSSFIAEYDLNGIIISAHRSTENQSWSKGVDIDVDLNRNIYVTGTFYDSLSFGSLSINYNLPKDGIYILKYDSAWNPVWLTSINSNSSMVPIQQEVYSLDVSDSGNVFLCGYFGGGIGRGNLVIGSLGIISDSLMYSSFFLKVDMNGNAIWLNKGTTLTSAYYFGNFAEQIVSDNSGNAYAVGYFYSQIEFGNLPVLTAGNSTDLYLVKFDPSGNPSWTLQSTHSGNMGFIQAAGLAVDRNQNIVTIGNADVNVIFSPLPPSGGNGFLIKHDSTSNPLCIQSYIGSLQDICLDSLGNAFTIASITGSHFSSIKITKWNTLCNTTFDILIENDFVNRIESPEKTDEVHIFPNPIQNNFNITLLHDKPVDLQIYSWDGKIILTKKLLEKITTVDFQDIVPGIYTCVLKGENFTTVKRIVKVD